MTGTEGTWIDWQCLLDAAGLLARCRYTLQYTYPYAYYMDAGPRKELVCVSTNCNSLCDLTGFWFLFSVWVPAGSVGGWNRKLVLESGTGRNNRPRGPWHSNGRLWETPHYSFARLSRVVTLHEVQPKWYIAKYEIMCLESTYRVGALFWFSWLSLYLRRTNWGYVLSILIIFVSYINFFFFSKTSTFIVFFRFLLRIFLLVVVLCFYCTGKK